MATKEKEKTDASKEQRDQKSSKEVKIKVPASKIVETRKRRPLL